MKVHELERSGGQQGGRLLLVLAKGEEAVETIKKVAVERRLGTCGITAVGAFSKATLGYFDREQRKYLPIPVTEQAEVLSLVGDVAESPDGKPAVHIHAILGLRDGTTRGGHLLQGQVWPTLEVMIDESAARLKKRLDPETGLALFVAE
jgi:predicted DNA-binding protein with PD1-like motif